MNFPRRIAVYIAALHCLFLFSCNSPKAPVDTGTCPLSVQQQFEQISQQITAADSTVIRQLKMLYLDNPAACRNQLFPGIIDLLFRKAYHDPLADTTLPAFFLERTRDKDLNSYKRLKALLVLGAYYNYILKMPDSAGVILARSAQPEFRFNDSLSRSYHSLMAEIRLSENRMQEAATHYLKALELAEQLKDSVSIAAISVNFANQYSRMREWSKAIGMRQKGLDYFRARQDINGLFVSYVGMGSDYGEAARYDSARKYNRMAVALLNGEFKNPIVTQTLYNNIAAISMTTRQYDTAIYYFNKVRQLLDEQTYNEAAEIFHLMASTVAYASIRDVSPEISKIKQYIKDYYQSGDIQGAKNGYYCLYNIASIQENPEQALRYYKSWDSLKNVLSDRENLKYVAELETRYKTKQKELTIQYQQEELNAKKIQNLLLWVLLFSLALVTVFIINRIQLKRNKRETLIQQQFTSRMLEQTEEERSRIARDLHDDISQNLIVLKNSIRQTNAAAAGQIDEIINDIRMISRNLHPVMLDQAGLKNSVEYLCNSMMEHHEVFISSELEYTKTLSRQAELHLFRMIQEALNNMIRHSKAEAAKVTITEQNHYVITTIQDNGAGFNVSETLKKQGAFGLLSIIERCKSQKGKTDISSSEQGTLISIQIPYTNE